MTSPQDPADISQPPHDLQAESACLGACLYDRDAIIAAANLISHDDFYHGPHRAIFRAILELHASGDSVDLVTTASRMSAQQTLEAAGSHEYLARLISATPTSLNSEHYARIIADASSKRALIRAGQDIIRAAYEPANSAGDAAIAAHQALSNAATRISANDFIPIRKTLDDFLQNPEADMPAHTLDAHAIPSGFLHLDQIIGGWRPAELTILGARPSTGKSAFAINTASIAAESGYSIAIFTLEMSPVLIAQRILAAESDISINQIRDGTINEHQHTELVHAIGRVSDYSIFMDHSPYITVDDIRLRSHRLHSQQPIHLIIIDYLQLISSPNRSGYNRTQELAQITRSLKSLAVDLNVPVIACSQLSRASENRPDHRPRLDDLRDSGAIEQDADIVILIHRPDKHATAQEWAVTNPGERYPANVADFIVAKQRQGPTGLAKLPFLPDQAKFGSYTSPVTSDTF